MKNIQISFDDDMLAEIDRIVSTSGISFPDIVKDALRQWLKRREISKFEEEWIEKLKSAPDNPEDAEKWIAIQYRSDDESW